MPLQIVAIFFALIMLSACASSSHSYTPARPIDFSTERIIPLPFDIVWDKYVEALSSSFFVINNISRDSRIINVSFSSSRPGEFVDCGYTQRESYHPASGKQRFSYATADSSTYNAGQKGSNIIWTVSRDARLEGRANIYMMPRNNDATAIQVSSKYVWSVMTRGYSNLGAIAPSESSMIDFSSSSQGTLPGPGGGITCVSKGALEKKMLNLI